MAEPRKQPANARGEEFVLQGMAVVGGAGAVIALPLLAAAAQDEAPVQVIVLTFALPIALVAVGRLREHRVMQIAAAVVAAVVAVLLAVGTGPTAFLAVLLLAVGAPVSLVLVGRYLLERDRLAGGAWLLAVTIALITGFLTLGAGAGGGVGAVLAATFAGCAIALFRLRRSHPADGGS